MQPGEVEQARITALRGDAEHALPILVRYADAGDDGAAATAAELLAYLWRWDEAIAQAGRLVANPFAVYAGNVFDDLVRLLGRAGCETKDWQRVAALADQASQRVEADLRANPWGFPPTKIEGAAYRLLTILDRLREYALGDGAIQLYGHLDIFTPQKSVPKPALFEAAMEHKSNRTSVERRLFLACMHHLDDEMIRLFHTMEGRVRFECAVPVAKAFLRRGDVAMAWQAIRDNWPDWAPVDRAQTAPLVLLIDEDLRNLMTRERAEELLHIPRAARFHDLANR